MFEFCFIPLDDSLFPKSPPQNTIQFEEKSTNEPNVSKRNERKQIERKTQFISFLPQHK